MMPALSGCCAIIGFMAHESLRLRAHSIIIVVNMWDVKDFFKETVPIENVPMLQNVVNALKVI